jgi:hypothetical protein
MGEGFPTMALAKDSHPYRTAAALVADEMHGFVVRFGQGASRLDEI